MTYFIHIHKKYLELGPLQDFSSYYWFELVIYFVCVVRVDFVWCYWF